MVILTIFLILLMTRKIDHKWEDVASLLLSLEYDSEEGFPIESVARKYFRKSFLRFKKNFKQLLYCAQILQKNMLLHKNSSFYVFGYFAISKNSSRKWMNEI